MLAGKHRFTPQLDHFTFESLQEIENSIINAQETIYQYEQALAASNQSVAELLINYSKEFVHEFSQIITDKKQEEFKTRQTLYKSYQQLHDTRIDWRKKVISKLKEEYFTKKRDFSEATSNNSRVLKQLEDHPATQIKSDEGFGPFELGQNEIILYTDHKLGSGAFGDVYKGLCRGKEVAVKTLKQAKFNPNTVEEFFRECSIMRSLPHTNILLFMGACTVPGHYKLVTEIAPNGSLDKLLHPPEDAETKNKLHFTRKVSIAREIAEGINWLHKQNPPLLHLDLKPANILVMDDWTVKIADFGISRLQRSLEKKEESNPMHGIGGTPLYMPPEMYDKNPIPTVKCDVYAYGMIVWELFSERIPYDGKYKSILSLTVAVTQNIRPEIPDKISGSLSHLIMDCWDPDPGRRPNFYEILSKEYDYFNKILLEWIDNGQSRITSFWAKFGQDGAIPDQVPWDKFIEEFCHVMNISTNDQTYTRSLKGVAILLNASGDSGVVKLQNFEQFVQWFSPLQPVRPGLRSTLDDVVTLLSKPWFWGYVSSNVAAQKLENAPTGTYLVRFSENSEGQIVISRKIKPPSKKESSVQHTRISPKLNVPLVTRVNNKIKEFNLKKPLQDGRPAEFIALFSIDQNERHLYAPSVSEVIFHTPWHGTNVIY